MARINPWGLVGGTTKEESAARKSLVDKLRTSEIPDEELLSNLGLFLPRQDLSRLLFMHDLYRRIIPVHGVVMEFGVRWGQNMSLFSNFRGIYEPYNYNRKIIGFDTFSGFPKIAHEDQAQSSNVQEGDYGVATSWKNQLIEVLDFHQTNSPIPHKLKYELVEGDASLTVPEYLSKHPELVISLAYFDFDLFLPTRDALTAILPRLTKGSVLAFDELNVPEFPGETVALREVLGLGAYAIQRSPISPLTSFLVIE